MHHRRSSNSYGTLPTVSVGHMKGLGVHTKSLVSLPRRLHRPSCLPDVVFSDVASIPLGPDSVEYWGAWTTLGHVLIAIRHHLKPQNVEVGICRILDGYMYLCHFLSFLKNNIWLCQECSHW